MVDGPGEQDRRVSAGVVIVALAALLGACRDGAHVDRVTVETRDGIRIVRNPRVPLEPRFSPSLEEDLKIGADTGSDGQVMFESILPQGSIDVDPSGNIYIADWQSCQVVVLDPGGRWLKTFGRSGQGPGEFQSASAVRVLEDGGIAVFDNANMRLSVFAADGRLVREQSLAGVPHLLSAQIDSRGDLFGFVVRVEGRSRIWDLTRVSADATKVDRIARFSTPFRPAPGRARLFLTLPEFRLTSRDEIVWGQWDAYALSIGCNDGRLRAIVRKDHRPVAVTAKDIEDEMDRRFGPGVRPPDMRPLAPSHFPAWNMIVVADDGRLFVRTREPVAGGIRVVFDVFSDQGSYLYSLALPGTPLLIARGRLYTREEDDDGAILIKRYVMK